MTQPFLCAQACSAQSGDGVSDGLDWLAGKLAAKAKQAK
jgi:hypothetical protein